jgi:UDP-glucose 4-epimerase
LIQKLKNKNKHIKIYGDGSQERSFTSVFEVAKCIYLISSKKKCENKTFNVGSEKSTSIIELIKIISKILKINKKIIKSKSFVSDVKFNKCNSSKILKFTGYKPVKDIKSVINDLI